MSFGGIILRSSLVMLISLSCLIWLVAAELASNAENERISPADEYINKSLKEIAEYESDDPFGSATPYIVREVREAARNNSSNTTAFTKPSQALRAVEGTMISEDTSLVDEYISKSLNETEEYESDDVFGPATPHESKQMNDKTSNATAGK